MRERPREPPTLKAEDVNEQRDDLPSREIEDDHKTDHGFQAREVATVDPGIDHAGLAAEELGELGLGHLASVEDRPEVTSEGPHGRSEIVGARHHDETLHCECSASQEPNADGISNAAVSGYQDGVSEPRKRGVKRWINDTWRDEVEAAMARRGMKHKKDLAEAVGCEPTVISLVLKRTREEGSIETSGWAKEISDELQIQLPVPLEGWRGVVIEKMEALRRVHEEDFHYELADLIDRIDKVVARRLTRNSARPLNSDHASAVERSHGGPPQTTPEAGPRPRRPSRRRR